jgi:HlyD family secretion protein
MIRPQPLRSPRNSGPFTSLTTGGTGEHRKTPDRLLFQRCRRLVSAGLLVSGLIGIVACSKEAAEKEPLVSVQAAAARRADIAQEVTTEAVLYPLHQSAITPKISAPVLKFYVNRGDKVHAGQLLAVLDNKDLAAAVMENQGSYQQAQATYDSTVTAALPEQMQTAEADVKSAKAAFAAAQQLYKSSQNLYEQGALAKRQLDQAQVGFVQAQAQLAQAEQHLQKLQSVGKQAQVKAAQGQLAAAQGKYDGAKAQLAYSEIRSPINGVVTDRPLYSGEMAAAGTPLITVMEISQIVARAHIPESEAALLKVGNAAELSAADGTKIPGKVTVVSPALDPNSTTVQVWVEAANPHGQLKPGSTTALHMIARTVKDALVVPTVAILTGPDGATSVMVVGKDGRAHQTTVETGIRQGDQTQIVNGLHEGEQVVTEGAYGLPDGTKVQISSPAGPSGG